MKISKNTFENYLFLQTETQMLKHSLDWFQMQGKVINSQNYRFHYGSRILKEKNLDRINSKLIFQDTIIEYYINQFRIDDEVSFRQESKTRYALHPFFKAQGTVKTVSRT